MSVQRYKVRDGYTFLFLTQIRDGQGNVHDFRKDNPKGPGEIVEVSPMQTLGQEHKLELVEAVIMQCNNSGCGKEFETKAINLAYAYCPHCRGRGGVLLRVAETSKVDKDRQDLGVERKREEVPALEPLDDLEDDDAGLTANDPNADVEDEDDKPVPQHPAAYKPPHGRRKGKR